MSAMQHFQFEDHRVRVLVRDELPWWVALDVCGVLEIVNPRHATSRLDDDEKDDVVINDAIGRPQMTKVINESGLYSLILTSTKPEARRFKKWVTSELLPTLRRTGHYVLDDDEGEFPSVADRKAWGISIAKLNAAARMISTVNRIYGPDAARALYEMEPGLPDIARLGVGKLAGSPADDPTGCLQHLLNASTGKAVPLRELLARALDDGTGVKRLEDYGLRLDPPEAPGHVAVANTHRFFASVYAETQWCLEWDMALVKLAGARPGKQMEIGGNSCRVTLIPKRTISEAIRPLN